MATATFSGTYTQNGGESYAAGTVDITPYGGDTVTATLDDSGHYSQTVTLVLTSSSGVWENSAGAIVTSPPAGGTQIIPPNGTVTKGKCRVVEHITGRPAETSTFDVRASTTVNTGRDVGTVLTAGGGGGGGAVDSVDGQTGDVDLSSIYLQKPTGSPEVGQMPIVTDDDPLTVGWGEAGSDASSIGGVTIAGTPATGQVPVAINGASALWGSPSFGPGDHDLRLTLVGVTFAPGQREITFETATVAAHGTSLSINGDGRVAMADPGVYIMTGQVQFDDGFDEGAGTGYRHVNFATDHGDDPAYTPKVAAPGFGGQSTIVPVSVCWREQDDTDYVILRLNNGSPVDVTVQVSLAFVRLR